MGIIFIICIILIAFIVAIILADLERCMCIYLIHFLFAEKVADFIIDNLKRFKHWNTNNDTTDNNKSPLSDLKVDIQGSSGEIGMLTTIELPHQEKEHKNEYYYNNKIPMFFQPVVYGISCISRHGGIICLLKKLCQPKENLTIYGF